MKKLLSKAFIIAEIGINHNGDMSLAREMIDQACNSGADAVKFQTYKTERLVSKETPKVSYQENIPWVTDFLVSKGIKIFSIEPQKNSLEEIFLRETEGD